ncbi:hypothetical protein C9J12_25310 [Photobacterium frigidiphilum]|uniref:Uncharacterized protein n=1 Tax=Photobacterium frigidiphilum TaxID=264736 RepID=A0A2T3J7Z7_9GAMM|nr:hypothetical protein [Photobacterium frigidiphilum]PSU44899.1 hypothetical protein C9J12_25310 [Photobacterium frigidiphilum]
MSLNRKVRPNLTNYDVLEMVRSELRESEKRVMKKMVLTAVCTVFSIFMIITLVVSTQGKTVRNYAAEAMKKAFEAERAVYIIDEAAGTNFLEQSKQTK